jgi:hypothetical protein
MTGHAGGSIHDITAATLAVPLAILVASQLSRSTLSWVPPPAPGVAGRTRGAVYIAGGAELDCFLSCHRRLCAAGGSAHCDAAVADASGASNPVCPPASAHCTHRRLYRGRRGSVGVFTHTAGYAEAQRSSTLSLSLMGSCFTSPLRLAHPSRGEVCVLVLTPSLVPHSWDATSCRGCSMQRVFT